MIAPTIAIMLIFAVGDIMSSNTDLILLLYNNATMKTADVFGTYVYREGLLTGKTSLGHRHRPVRLHGESDPCFHRQQMQQ